MSGAPKIMIFLQLIIGSILFWASANVCKYNFAIEKRTDLLNIITEEIDPSLGNAKYYYYQELNCSNVNLDWDIERVIDNLKTVSVLVYQELNTDIKGNPN